MVAGTLLPSATLAELASDVWPEQDGFGGIGACPKRYTHH